MTNEQRRAALSKARKKALEWAEKAEDEVGRQLGRESLQMAGMWADVAQALKTGDPVGDGVTWSHEQH